ncbi:hypothetical protein [Burkholderia ubonensis]|uniref:DUF7079 family protein n=1 Tax=Burkholderia ubonensis TaxID=101571 RepID=UPI000755AA25|nr:hypothetical protein [Burkholderia ubonensis]KVO08480.1 hypothetical protein WJ71_05130 [Burkholderia ubonensis]
MADSVSARERCNCWLVMSDLFVDNEVDYKAVAEALVRDCPNMDCAELKCTLFEEVAPVLGTNGLTPAPSVWMGFDGDAVMRDVAERLTQQHLSFYRRVTGGIWSTMCRFLFRSWWAELERELKTLGKA